MVRCLFVRNFSYLKFLYVVVGLNGINVKVFVLGDLTKDEAFDYYLSLNPATTRAHFDKNVFPVTGGRMQLIADFDEQERFSGPVKSGWIKNTSSLDETHCCSE